MRVFAIVVLVLAAVAILAGLSIAVFAADGTEAAPTSLWTYFAEPLALVLGTIITIALGWLTPVLARLIGQDEANKLQAALQAAGNRAAGIAIMRLSGRAFSLTGPLPAADAKLAIDSGVAYLKETMADTIRKLGAGDETLRKIVEANLGLKIAGK